MYPVLFRLPVVQWPIYGYGVMLGLSLLIAWYLILWLCVRDGMEKERMAKAFTFTVVTGLIGTRLFYVITNPDRFHNLIDVFKVNQGGLVAYGGFITGTLGAWYYCRKHKLSFFAWVDCVVPGVCTGLAVTRLGCLLAGCDFGKVSTVPWALRFPKDSPAYVEQLRRGMLAATDTQSLPLHPTQIYESLTGLFIFAVLMLVRRYYRKFSGQIFAIFAILYGVIRYYLETLRADEQRGEIGPFSTSQAIAIVTFVLSVGLYVVLAKKAKENPQAWRMWERQPAPAAPPPPSAARPGKRRRRR